MSGGTLLLLFIIFLIWKMLGMITFISEGNVFSTYDKQGDLIKRFGKPTCFKIYHIFTTLIMLPTLIVYGTAYGIWKCIIYPLYFISKVLLNITLWKDLNTNKLDEVIKEQQHRNSTKNEHL